MTHQHFGRRYTAELTPEQVYKATRTDAEAQTARLEQAMADAIAASDFDLFRLALCAEGNLYPQTAINLMFSGHREGMERLRAQQSKRQSGRAAHPRRDKLLDQALRKIAAMDVSNKERWSALFHELDRAATSPKELDAPELKKCTIQYVRAGGSIGEITYGTMQNLMTKLRQSHS